MQKVGAQYALKKISDYVMAPPPQAEAAESDVEAAATTPALADLDGQVITDEEGQRIGVARRVANIAVYLIAESRAGLDDQLKSTIVDPESRVFFHHDDAGRLTGLIYAPDPSTQPAPVSVTRADDI
ncbi:MAG: hypothetical protein IT336_10340 [Thermomicrobiales bacterium]|nr:hypothetical protein [Thermomicrobiales bacterium]